MKKNLDVLQVFRNALVCFRNVPTLPNITCLFLPGGLQGCIYRVETTDTKSVNIWLFNFTFDKLVMGYDNLLESKDDFDKRMIFNTAYVLYMLKNCFFITNSYASLFCVDSSKDWVYSSRLYISIKFDISSQFSTDQNIEDIIVELLAIISKFKFDGVTGYFIAPAHQVNLIESLLRAKQIRINSNLLKIYTFK